MRQEQIDRVLKHTKIINGSTHVQADHQQEALQLQKVYKYNTVIYNPDSFLSVNN